MKTNILLLIGLGVAALWFLGARGATIVPPIPPAILMRYEGPDAGPGMPHGKTAWIPAEAVSQFEKPVGEWTRV